MQITALSFGIGSLLVAAGLKFVPEEKIDKIPALINEDAVAEGGNDFLGDMQKKMQGKY